MARERTPERIEGNNEGSSSIVSYSPIVRSMGGAGLQFELRTFDPSKTEQKLRRNSVFCCLLSELGSIIFVFAVIVCLEKSKIIACRKVLNDELCVCVAVPE